MRLLTVLSVTIGRRTAFPGVLRYDHNQAIGCEHCRERLEVSYATYICPEKRYRLTELFAHHHRPCAEYAGRPVLAQAARRARREIAKMRSKR